MTVIIDLDRRIDTRKEDDLPPGSISAPYHQGDILLRPDVISPEDVELFIAADRKRLDGIVALELEGENAHAHKVGTVDAFEAPGDDSANAEKAGPFGRPVP
jgi:hypothetical protein